MVSLKECHECGRRSGAAIGGPCVVKSHKVLQPSGKYAPMRLCGDCWAYVKDMGWGYSKV